MATSISNIPTEERPFPQFGKLPIEIQTEIWEIAANHGRVVCVRSSDIVSWSRTNNPAVLQTCRESRKVASNVYSVVFKWKSGAFVYIHPTKDTVYIQAEYIQLNRLLKKALVPIRHLMLSDDYYGSGCRLSFSGCSLPASSRGRLFLNIVDIHAWSSTWETISFAEFAFHEISRAGYETIVESSDRATEQQRVNKIIYGIFKDRFKQTETKNYLSHPVCRIVSLG